MRERGFPGAAFSIARQGKVLYTQAYGLADRETDEKVRPESLFRIASLSKPITALAILKLAESQGLDLDFRFTEILSRDKRFPAASQWTEGWDRITIRHLLHHTGGWDRGKSFDPMFRTLDIQRTLNLKEVPDTWDVIRYMSRQPLDFSPGRNYAYSNFGYCILGRVIEVISGRTYESFVTQHLLAPLNIRDMRLGATRLNERVPGEVRYHMSRNQTARSVFSSVEQKVAWPYGGFLLEFMDAHGGWIASAPDLARLTASLQSPETCAILKPETLRQLSQPPAPPVSRKEEALDDTYYGLGWMIRPRGEGGRHNAWHSGSLPGTSTLWVRRADGIGFVILFNQRSDDERSKDAEIDPQLNRAINSVQLGRETIP